jgi:alginate O-acetyltransferase complex protein AlgI
MNFAQPEYALLLALIVLANAWLGGRFARKVILLVASFYFYAYWDYRFAGLLALSTAIGFGLGLAIESAQRPSVRVGLLAISVIWNLGLLAFFKYANFIVGPLVPLLGLMDWHVLTYGIVLPIGISFYTFQLLSYSIDVYRRQVRATRSLLDFAIYIAFFPQLVAGPIVRASEFLPQLAQMPKPTGATFYSGLTQLLRGLVKKMLIADTLATFVDPVMAGPDLFAGPTVWLALFAYAGQIYADFAGYSDIAIGSARLLGFELPENFRHPYLADSPSDFWRRWHITLSTWLRDYLYIPLGGSRGSSFATALTLVVTMGLGGLWHGASWNFVLWGLWHGVLLILTRSWRDRPVDGWRRVLRILLTFSLVTAGWTLFRTAGASEFAALWGQMIWPNAGYAWFPPLPLVALALLLIEHLVWSSRHRELLSLPADRWQTPWLVGLAIAALVLFAPTGFRPFVYFQF